jgi:hypothetical protein
VKIGKDTSEDVAKPRNASSHQDLQEAWK